MDIFISYRRKVENAENSSAELINDKLRSLGVETFFDKSSIHNEDFWERIKEGIDKCPNFLMIYTKGYLTKRDDEEDFVIKEILYAKSRKKNMIAIAFDGFDISEADWTAETEELNWIKQKNAKTYSADYSESSLQYIIGSMVNHKGEKFSLDKKITNNSWYTEHEMTDEDRVWIITDHAVCRELDWKVMSKAINTEGLFPDKKDLSLFVYKAYDIKTYKFKYDLGLPEEDNKKDGKKKGKKNKKKDKSKYKCDHRISQVYGVTYASLMDEADEIFGQGHFITDDFPTEDYFDKIEELLLNNGLQYFDVMDLTLIVKDVEKPEQLVCKLTKYLNPEGGVMYIRELDDDYVDAYPDKDGKIRRLCRYLDLDDGAGNRHTGKKIYSYLKRADADEIYISNEIISTANKNADYRQTMCRSYFSYLIPEFRALIEPTEENKQNPNYEKYQEAYNWLLQNYDEIERGFRSPEFYFRGGYIAGYGIFSSKGSDLKYYKRMI